MTAQDVQTYRYESRGRTPLNIALFAFGIGITALAAATGAMWLVFLPFGAFSAMMGYLVILDPRWTGDQRVADPRLEQVRNRHDRRRRD